MRYAIVFFCAISLKNAHTNGMKNKREHFLDLVIYQIYPRSFYDTNGDGIGDLNGITQKLDHLTALGVNAIWLCPCYKSPNRDNGYDVADYRDIMTEFGTLDDWKRLREETKKRDIKLIMDLVFNHTSDRHFWFQEAKKSRDNPYHDYYIWTDAPLNKWKSVFGGSAWAYNKQTQEYYLHSFAVEQPDLNWENPKVRKECQAIVDFWVDMGVDGFRCDVLDFISKDFTQNKMYNGPKLHDYIRGLFGREKTKRIFTVGECQSNEKDICDICGKDRKELTTVFQFDHIHMARKNKYRPKEFSFDKLKKILVKWQTFCEKHDLLYTLFTDNHDNPYFLSRTEYAKQYRFELATALATIFYLLKGIPFLYQTQEYGAINPYYNKVSDFNEVETLQYYKAQRKKLPRKEVLKELNIGSRDNTRRPFAWTDDKANCHGFSKATPWITPHSLADTINLERDKNAEKSVFRFYQNLLALRASSPCLRYGKFDDLTKKKDTFVFTRTDKNTQFFIVCNFEKEKAIPLPISEQSHRRVLYNYTDAMPYSTHFRPFEIAVYEKL